VKPNAVNMRYCQILLFMHGKMWQKKMNLLKMSGPQIRLCLFTFRPIASKQLNSLLTIATRSWIGGEAVTHPLWVQEVPDSIPVSGKDFYVLLLLCFYILSINSLFVTKFSKSFCNDNLFSKLNILQASWLIIRV